jgi:hypothetical protein
MSPKVPSAKDITAAAQAAAETAQSVASGAMRMDTILPQLEALVATGNDVYNAVASVPGVSTLSRLATRGSGAPPKEKPSRGRGAPKKI